MKRKQNKTSFFLAVSSPLISDPPTGRVRCLMVPAFPQCLLDPERFVLHSDCAPAKVTVPVSHWRPTSPPPCPSASSSQTALRRLSRTSPSRSGYLSRSALTVPLSLLAFNVAQNKLFAWLQMILNPIKR